MKAPDSGVTEAAGPGRRRPVAVCATVRNAEAEILQLLSDLEKQTTSFDFEVVLVDGGSTDGTLAALKLRAEDSSLKITVDQRGGNISRGRNFAILRSDADV